MSNSGTPEIFLSLISTIPWDAWLLPLLGWSALIVAIYFAMICVAVVLRRQWIEREKLIYPLAQLPLDIVLKYWGPRGFRAVRPFFMGAILGQFASAGVWLVIDACTGMTDNRIFSW